MALTVWSVLGLVAAGVVVGNLSALMGVGGGILMVPLMVVALDFSQHLAEGTSLLVIVPTSIAGVIAHRRRDYVSFRHGALLALGGIAGAYAGAELALRMSGAALESVFGLFLAFIGLRMAVAALRRRN